MWVNFHYKSPFNFSAVEVIFDIPKDFLCKLLKYMYLYYELSLEPCIK